MEQEPNFTIEEVAGHEPQGVPMTEEQAYYLHEFIDPQLEKIFADLEAEKVRRQLADAYQMRTIPSLHERI